MRISCLLGMVGWLVGFRGLTFCSCCTRFSWSSMYCWYILRSFIYLSRGPSSVCFVKATASLQQNRPQIILKKHGLGGAAGLTPSRIFREHMVDVFLLNVLLCWLRLKKIFGVLRVRVQSPVSSVQFAVVKSGGAEQNHPG